MSTLAPIALFAYRRLDHLRRTVEALRANPESAQSDLIVYSDGAKDAGAAADVDAVRAYARTITGFRSLDIVARPHNFGLARSIISGVSQVLERSERVIVVEDDIVTSPHFLRYMNEALETYRADARVVSVHGYVYPVDASLPDTFFLRGADCWGWATWRRAWKLFNPDGAQLLAEIRRQDLTRPFDYDGAFSNVVMLEDQIAGRNDSWAIRWHASTFLAGGLTLYPGRSLVQNIGNDSSGVHSTATDRFGVSMSKTPVPVGGIAVEDSAAARAAFSRFGRGDARQGAGRRSRLRTFLSRILR